MRIQLPESFDPAQITAQPGERRNHSESTNTSQYISRQAHTESNARTYAKNFKIVMEQARGIFVKDVDGHLFYDCLCGAGTLALGHNHPVVKDAVLKAVESDLPLLTLDMTTPVKDAFVEELFKTLPAEFSKDAKVQFCGPSGADAIEAAIKLAKIATGRNGIFAFHGGYHGQTNGALAVMGNVDTKAPVSGLMAGVQFLPFPYQFRNPMGVSGAADCDVACINYIENMLTDAESGIVKPAAILMEVVQGEGGTVPASDFFMQEIRRITREHDILLIIDEVQTGFGRTGKMFAFEHSGITPDVVVMSKALGGSLPLAAVMYHKRLDVWNSGAHTGTFRGNQLAMAAGRVNMQFIKENNLAERAVEMGKRFKKNLQAIAETTNVIGDIRVKGLMIGIELINPLKPENRLGHPAAFPELSKKVRAACIERGLMVELGGRHSSVVRMLPPLIITEEQIDHVCEIFKSALAAAEESVHAEMAMLETVNIATDLGNAFETVLHAKPSVN